MNDGAKSLYGAIVGAGGSGGGGVTPSGSLTITANGTYDISDKAEVVINVGNVTLTLNGGYAGNDNYDGYWWSWDEEYGWDHYTQTQNQTAIAGSSVNPSYTGQAYYDSDEGYGVNGWAINVDDSNPSPDYTLLGWATTAGAETPNITFPMTITQNTTIYAVWGET